MRRYHHCGRAAGTWMMNVAAGGGSAGASGRRYPVVVVGLGRTGLSCARLLRREGVRFAVTDTRATPPCLDVARRELPEVPLFLGGLDAGLLAAAEQLVMSPGLAPDLPALVEAQRRGVERIGDIEMFRRRARAPIVAVTGSNGKSTVVSLFADMARRAGRRVGLGGNLGRPALEMLDEDCELYVLEVSSFQLETVGELGATAAAVLNIASDHLDRYADLETYASVKERIYGGCRHMVINLDDCRVRRMQRPGPRVHGYTVRGISHDGYGLAQTAEGPQLAECGRPLLPLSALRVPGMHYVSNCLAALALGRAVQLPSSAMLEALTTFSGLPHRLEWVRKQGGVDWYNDSKATNAAAACAALRSLGAGKRKVVLLAGGEAKDEDDYARLAHVARGRLRAVVLLGRDAALLRRWFVPVPVPVIEARDMEHAVGLAGRLSQPGDAVLLSPACASFDMYADYRERGRAFIAALGRLPRRPER